MNKLNVPARSSLFYILSGIFIKMIGILSTPVFTRILTESEYGTFALYMSILGIALGVLSPFCSGSQLFRISEEYKDKKSSVLLTCILPIFITSLLICLVLFAFNGILNFEYYVIPCLSLQVFSDCVGLLFLTFKRYEYDFSKVIFINISETVLSIILSFILIRVFTLGYLGRILGLLIPSFLTASVFILCTLFQNGKIKKKILKFSLSLSSPLVFGSLAGSLGGQLDRLLFTFLLGEVMMAKYSVAHSLGIGLNFLIAAVSSSLIPWTSRRLTHGGAERIPSVSSAIGEIFLSASLLLIALSPEALLFLAPISYYEALPSVAPIALSLFFAFLSSFASSILVKEGHGKMLIRSRLFSLCAGLLSGVILIPSFGYLGAGLCVFICELSLSAFDLVLLKRGGLMSVFPFKNIRIPLALTLSVGILMSIFSSSLPIRILLLTIPACMLINALYNARELMVEKESL